MSIVDRGMSLSYILMGSSTLRNVPKRGLGYSAIRFWIYALVGTVVWLLVVIPLSILRVSESVSLRLDTGRGGLQKLGTPTNGSKNILQPLFGPGIVDQLRPERSGKGDGDIAENEESPGEGAKEVDVLVRRIVAEAGARGHGAMEFDIRAQILQRALVGRGMSELGDGLTTTDLRMMGRGGDARALMRSRAMKRAMRRTMENLGEWPLVDNPDPGPQKQNYLDQWKESVTWPPRNEKTSKLEGINGFGVRNAGRLPGGKVPMTGIIVVLYVHKRAHYLNSTLEALEKVKGIGGILLIVR